MNNHRHKGYVVTSPSGSVSLKEIPVPIYATRELASKAGKASGRKFCIVETSKFYRTSFGRTVQILTARKARLIPPQVVAPEIVTPPKVAPLTSLLTRLKAKKAEREFEATIAKHTRLAHSSENENRVFATARLMRETLQRESDERNRLSSQSHLAVAMTPPKPCLVDHVSDSQLFEIYNRQTPEITAEIDCAAKKRLTRQEINKLVKSHSVMATLILFRSGNLPKSYRKSDRLAKLLNLK